MNEEEKRPILSYVIVNAECPRSLETEVNKYFKWGYRPTGGPFHMKFFFKEKICQAMVRK